MSRIIGKVTRGRIRIGTTKAALVLSVAGTLFFASETPVDAPVISYPEQTQNYPVSGGGVTISKKKKTIDDQQIIDENEIIEIVQLTLSKFII
jgi:hypothetical protein